MPLIPVLRALFPWYAVLAAGIAVFALTESIGYRALGSAGQSVLGAVSGGIAALGLLMKIHEMHHRAEIWRPARPSDFSRGAKAVGALAGVCGLLDGAFRALHLPYRWVPVILAACLGAAAAGLARMAKSTPAEEHP